MITTREETDPGFPSKPFLLTPFCIDSSLSVEANILIHLVSRMLLCNHLTLFVGEGVAIMCDSSLNVKVLIQL